MTNQYLYLSWNPKNPCYNKEEAWPASLFPEAEYHYFHECGSLLCALAILLRHHGFEKENDEALFNPWILNQRLTDCGAFSPAADLHLHLVSRLYPLDYYGFITFHPGILEDLGRNKWLCLFLVQKEGGGRSFAALHSISGVSSEDVSVIEPGAGVRRLSDYKKVYDLRLFQRRRAAYESGSLAEPEEAGDGRRGTEKVRGKDGRRETEKVRDGQGDFETLVNEDHPLPAFYQPYKLIKLETVPDPKFMISASRLCLNETAAHAANAMFAQAAEDGYEGFMIFSAYRSHRDQCKIYKEEPGPFVALPGCSEHETGLAMDVKCPESADRNVWYSYLTGICHRYGFILRYPQEKVLITGIPGEEWHYRYVGKKAALKMHEEGWCLEEYWRYQKAGEIDK